MALPLLLGGAAKSLLGSGKKKPKSGKEVAGKIVKRTNKADKKAESKSQAPQQKLISSTSTFKGSSTTPKIKKLKPTGESSLDSALQGIQSTLSKLSSTVGNFVKFKRKESKEKTKRNNKVLARLRESGFAIVGGTLSLGKKLLDKVPFFDRIKDFFVNILLGGIVLMILDNIKPIIETIKKVVKEVKKVFKLLNEYLFEPLMEAGKFLIKTIPPIIDNIKKLIPAETIKTGIENFIKTLENTFPGLEEISNNIKKAINEIKNIELPDGTTVGETAGSSEYDTSSGGLLAEGGVEQGEKAKSQVSQAGFGESEFTLYRDVVAQIESGGEYDIQGGSGNMYAGRYQMGAAARQDAARFLGEEYQGDSEAARKTFREDKQMQERYFAAYTRANHQYLMDGSPEYKELSQEGKLQVLGYAHNAGWSRAADWLKSGMSDSFKDGFGTRSDKYSTSIRSAQEQRRQSVSPALRSSGTQSPGSTNGKFGQISSGYGDKDGQDTGVDIELYGKEGKIGKKYENQSAQGPYGGRGVPISFPYELTYNERIPGGRNAGAKSVTSQGSTNREVKGQGAGGFGHIGSYTYTDENGKRYEIMMGHGDRPFATFNEGQKIPAGTVLGYQGASGSSDDGAGGLYDHITFHVNSMDGGDANRVIRQFTNSLISGEGVKSGNKQPQVTAPTERKTAEEISKQTGYERTGTVFIPIASPNNGGGSSSSGGGAPSIIGGSSRDTYLQIMTETKLFRQ